MYLITYNRFIKWLKWIKWQVHISTASCSWWRAAWSLPSWSSTTTIARPTPTPCPPGSVGQSFSFCLFNWNNYFRWELCFCSGYHGYWGWVDPERSWPGRRSWSRARWRSWIWRRLPPSLCWPMCWTWMMTTDQTTGAISRFPLWITHFTGRYTFILTIWIDDMMRRKSRGNPEVES